jgi:hypothetical protein
VACLKETVTAGMQSIECVIASHFGVNGRAEKRIDWY